MTSRAMQALLDHRAAAVATRRALEPWFTEQGFTLDERTCTFIVRPGYGLTAPYAVPDAAGIAALRDDLLATLSWADAHDFAMRRGFGSCPHCGGVDAHDPDCARWGSRR